MAPRHLATQTGSAGANANRMMERIRRGRDAELHVARRLRRLGSEYYVIHALSLPAGGDADHVVVGPSGVFVIETKAYSTRVDLLDESVVVNGYRPHRDPMAQVRRAAKIVRGLLGTLVEYAGWVQPVLCLARARLERSRFVAGVLVTNPDHLCYLIRHWHAPGLPEERVRAAFAALASRLRQSQH